MTYRRPLNEIPNSKEGLTGWDQLGDADDLRSSVHARMLRKVEGVITSKDMVDVANFAMMLYHDLEKPLK